MTSKGRVAILPQAVSRPAFRVTERAAVTALLLGLIAWLPLQTPVTIVLHQYAGVSDAAARALLLAKDVLVGLLVVALLARHWREVRITWADRAAIVYVVVLFAYAILPTVLGSRLPPAAILASVREFLVPVELYALGRLAVTAGVRPGSIAVGFVVVSVVAVLFTLGTYLLLPVTLWSSTLDLVGFIREVQGVPAATSLWFISAVGSYGEVDGTLFARAIGPFAHPVGTGHYYVAALVVAVALAFRRLADGDRGRALLFALAAVLFGAAVVATISRGAWIAAGLAVLFIGWRMGRLRISLVALTITGLLVLTVPPYSLSIRSAASGTDSSTRGHQIELERGFETILGNPAGLGAGQADYFGKAFGQTSEGAQSAGVGENSYLSMYVTAGPVGLAAFLLWITGTWRRLWRAGRDAADGWLATAMTGGLLGVAVSSLTASTMLRFTTAATFWLILGLVAGAAISRLPATHEPRS